MLDYILSKMVLLIFLVLLVAAFTGFRGAIQDYFVQQHAQDIVRNLAERLRGMVVATTRLEDVRSFVLPRYLDVGGGRRVPYDVDCSVADHQGTKWVVFSLSVADRVIAYDGVAIPDAEVSCEGFPVASTSGSPIYMKKVISGERATYAIWGGEGS